LKHFLKKLIRWESFMAVMLVCEVLIFGSYNPKMLNPMVLFGSIDNFMSIAVISLFVTFVLITGGIDIQAGAIVGFSSICLGILWHDVGLNIWVAVILAIIIGAICGLISGFVIAYTRVQAMVVTLGGSFLYSGLAIAVSKLSSTAAYKGITQFPEGFTTFTKTKIGVIPSQLLIFIALVIIAYFILHRTKYGRKIFLCGINQSAAEYSGIHSKRVIMSTYVFSGAGAALAGVLITSYLGTAKADLGSSLTLPIITVVVFGGTSIFGGRGHIIGTALAALIIGVLQFGLSMVGMSTQYFDIPIGVLLVVTVAIRSVGSPGALTAYVRRLILKPAAGREEKK